MNRGQLRYPLSDLRMDEFAEYLELVYSLAEAQRGFIWRIQDSEGASQLNTLGFDEKISATVSVWDTVEALRDYTFETLHGAFLNRKGEWFDEVGGPQFVIGGIARTSHPTFSEAFAKLELPKRDRPYGCRV